MTINGVHGCRLPGSHQVLSNGCGKSKKILRSLLRSPCSYLRRTGSIESLRSWRAIIHPLALPACPLRLPLIEIFHLQATASADPTSICSLQPIVATVPRDNYNYSWESFRSITKIDSDKLKFSRAYQAKMTTLCFVLVSAKNGSHLFGK